MHGSDLRHWSGAVCGRGSDHIARLGQGLGGCAGSVWPQEAGWVRGAGVVCRSCRCRGGRVFTWSSQLSGCALQSGMGVDTQEHGQQRSIADQRPGHFSSGRFGTPHGDGTCAHGNLQSPRLRLATENAEELPVARIGCKRDRSTRVPDCNCASLLGHCTGVGCCS